MLRISDVFWIELWWIFRHFIDVKKDLQKNTLFFVQASGKFSSVSIMRNLKPNFLKIYSTKPYDFMIEILFKISLFFLYIKILLKFFSFWDIKNVSPKFQPWYAFELYAYKKQWFIRRFKKLCKNFIWFKIKLFHNWHNL